MVPSLSTQCIKCGVTLKYYEGCRNRFSGCAGVGKLRKPKDAWLKMKKICEVEERGM